MPLHALQTAPMEGLLRGRRLGCGVCVCVGGWPGYPGRLMRIQEWGAAHVPLESFLKDFFELFA